MKESVDFEKLAIIVSKMKAGDESANGLFYDLTHRALYRFSFFLSKDQASAHDLCHDSYIKAFLNIKGLKNNRGALGWLFQIAKNTFLDQKKKTKESLVTDSEELETSKSSPLDEWLVVKKILSTMEVQDQMLLIMIDLEGLSYHEAAEAMELSDDSIRMKLHKIRQDFIKKYNSTETN